MSRDLWIVVLAGGEGTRLSALTKALYGRELPKQFAVLAGERSLLQQTIDRAAHLAPLERILVVVSAHHTRLAREQLRDYPGVELVVQPHNLDTGPGLLLPLACIRARDPRARVAFLPSDHHVADPQPLLEALRADRPTRDRVTLIGVLPDSAETDYGWILRGPPLAGRAFAVRRFEEKPTADLAELLRLNGALWNTFISTGPVSTYWSLAQEHLPTHASLLAESSIEHAYATMPPANFSRDVLAKARGLVVVPVSDTGWCDWGSPRRVFESLQGTPHLEPLMRRMRVGPLPAPSLHRREPCTTDTRSLSKMISMSSIPS